MVPAYLFFVIIYLLLKTREFLAHDSRVTTQFLVGLLYVINCKKIKKDFTLFLFKWNVIQDSSFHTSTKCILDNMQEEYKPSHSVIVQSWVIDKTNSN